MSTLIFLHLVCVAALLGADLFSTLFSLGAAKAVPAAEGRCLKGLGAFTAPTRAAGRFPTGLASAEVPLPRATSPRAPQHARFKKWRPSAASARTSFF